MVYRNEHIYGDRIVAQRSDFKWGVCDLSGSVIVPFGKYDWIDGFEKGLASLGHFIGLGAQSGQDRIELLLQRGAGKGIFELRSAAARFAQAVDACCLIC